MILDARQVQMWWAWQWTRPCLLAPSIVASQSGNLQARGGAVAGVSWTSEMQDPGTRDKV